MDDSKRELLELMNTDMYGLQMVDSPVPSISTVDLNNSNMNKPLEKASFAEQHNSVVLDRINIAQNLGVHSKKVLQLVEQRKLVPEMYNAAIPAKSDVVKHAGWSLNDFEDLKILLNAGFGSVDYKKIDVSKNMGQSLQKNYKLSYLFDYFSSLSETSLIALSLSSVSTGLWIVFLAKVGTGASYIGYICSSLLSFWTSFAVYFTILNALLSDHSDIEYATFEIPVLASRWIVVNKTIQQLYTDTEQAEKDFIECVESENFKNFFKNKNFSNITSYDSLDDVLKKFHDAKNFLNNLRNVSIFSMQQEMSKNIHLDKPFDVVSENIAQIDEFVAEMHQFMQDIQKEAVIVAEKEKRKEKELEIQSAEYGALKLLDL